MLKTNSQCAFVCLADNFILLGWMLDALAMGMDRWLDKRLKP